MKKHRGMVVGILLASILALFVSGCASAPETPPEEPVVAVTAEPEATTVTTETEEEPKPEAEYNRAKSLRQLIERYDASQYAQERYEAAEDEFKKGETAYGTYNDTAKTAFEKAIDGYEFVIEKAFSQVTRKSQTDEYKKLSDSLKASVAMKTEYQAALAKYTEAQKAETDGDYEKAGLLFAETELLFKTIYETTKEKKERADAFIGDLDKELDEFEKLAKESEGGDQ